MKIVANDYNPQEIIRIIREWTELSQKDFGKTIHRSERGIQAFELGKRNYNMQTLIQIANTHGITITIEKKGK
ncbi:MAG: helix-turn-helix transcriptional regulator [Clostridia bacterium]|nr:helix-turn-helix transcriptional regulator [Clostridia bacterium]